MSKIIGPSIVTDGLILYLDSRNKRSYAGEPTTNLVSPDLSTWTSTTRATVTEVFNEQPPIKGGKVFLIEKTHDSAAGNALVRNGHAGSGPLSPNSTLNHTFSLYFKFLPSSQSGTKIDFDIGDGARANMNAVYDGKWYRLSCTGTGNVTDGTRDFVDIQLTGEIGNQVLVSCPQVELKEYATDFVDGERSSTNGWKNLISDSLHGNLNTVSFDSNGFFFDGVDDSIKITGNILGKSEFTASVWFKQIAGVTSFLINQYRSSAYGVGVRLSNSYIGIYDDTLANDSPILEVPYNFNEWYNIVIGFDGAEYFSYLNGELIGTVEQGNPNNPPYGDFYIGSRGSGGFYNGYIDSVAVWDKALTLEEVVQNFNSFKGRYSL